MDKWQDQAVALWGEKWKSTLALTAGISKRTVQRWASNECRPHPEVIRRLNETYKLWLENETLTDDTPTL